MMSGEEICLIHARGGAILMPTTPTYLLPDFFPNQHHRHQPFSASPPPLPQFFSAEEVGSATGQPSEGLLGVGVGECMSGLDFVERGYSLDRPQAMSRLGQEVTKNLGTTQHSLALSCALSTSPWQAEPQSGPAKRPRQIRSKFSTDAFSICSLQLHGPDASTASTLETLVAF